MADKYQQNQVKYRVKVPEMLSLPSPRSKESGYDSQRRRRSSHVFRKTINGLSATKNHQTPEKGGTNFLQIIEHLKNKRR